MAKASWEALCASCSWHLAESAFSLFTMSLLQRLQWQSPASLERQQRAVTDGMQGQLPTAASSLCNKGLCSTMPAAKCLQGPAVSPANNPTVACPAGMAVARQQCPQGPDLQAGQCAETLELTCCTLHLTQHLSIPMALRLS